MAGKEQKKDTHFFQLRNLWVSYSFPRLLASADLQSSVYFPDPNTAEESENDQVFCRRMEICSPGTDNRNNPFDRTQSTVITTPDAYFSPAKRQCVNTRPTEPDEIECTNISQKKDTHFFQLRNLWVSYSLGKCSIGSSRSRRY